MRTDTKHHIINKKKKKKKKKEKKKILYVMKTPLCLRSKEESRNLEFQECFIPEASVIYIYFFLRS